MTPYLGFKSMLKFEVSVSMRPRCQRSRCFARSRHVLGGLGPANRIGHEHNPVFSPLFAKEFVDAENKVHILSNGILAVPSHLYDNFFFEKTESA